MKTVGKKKGDAQHISGETQFRNNVRLYRQYWTCFNNQLL